MISQEKPRVRLDALGIATNVSSERVSAIAARLAPTFNPESSIGQKWLALGGESVLGKPLESPESLPGETGTYQQFEKGVVFESPAYGSVLVSNQIFSKWNALSLALKQELGCPVADYARFGTGGQSVYFERGMIVVRPDGKVFEVHGLIYVRYRDLGDVKSPLGLPVADEEVAPRNGRRSRFDRGDIYWHASVRNAREVHGSIRARWLALGGAEGFLGYPETDELPVMKNRQEVGRFNRFQGGTIYWSPQTGAWEVYGAIRATWENEYGGATGVLGFPTSGETSTPASGGRFNNFQNGVLVWHPGSHQFAGVYAFRTLEFYMDRFGARGDDGWGKGDQDLYVKVDVHASSGQRFKERMPKDGDYGPSEEIDRIFIKVPVVQGDLVINVRMEGWDSDWPDGDDRLGVVEGRYTIDNLWGIFEDAEHRQGNFIAVYKLRKPSEVDPSKEFREQFFWRFENFSTEKLTINQYAQTFRDVSELNFSVLDPSTWRPFDRLFYEVVYKRIACGGNCFGMCLESIYAQVGRSIYTEPIAQFGPENAEPNPTHHREIINEINIKHGYQAGAEAIDWFLLQFLAGNTHNPVHAFKSSRDMYRRGDYPVLVVTNSSFKVGGHVVRPYEWDERDPDRWIIRIADPNVPYKAAPSNDHERCRIEINPRTNTFRYVHGRDDVWTGSTWTGGRMYPMPFSWLCHQPRTPFWEVFALLTAGTLIILGEDGDTRQITDNTGKTFYEPGLAGAATQWQQIRQDATKRIPQMARIPVLANNVQAVMPEMYFVKEQAARSLQQDIATRSGRSYQWAMQSAAISASLVATGNGNVETVQLEGVNSGQPAIALATPNTAADKTVTLALAGGADKTKIFELRNLMVKSDQRIQASLDDGGQELVLENTGPEANFELHVQSGAGQGAVTARPRPIKLEAGKVARLRPIEWTKDGVIQAPLRMDVLDDVRGPVRRRIEL